MKRLLPIILLLLFCFSVPAQDIGNRFFLPANPQDVSVNPSELLALDKEISSWVSNGDPVGAEVLIIKNDKIILHEAYGWSDRERNQRLEKNSIYRVRSITKPFITTATLMLLEDGKITLDDPIKKHLQSFDQHETQQVTIRDLLTQTSGFGYRDLRDSRLPHAPSEYQSLQDLVEDMANFLPLGEKRKFLYHDSNASVMAAIIEKVTGQAVENFIQNNILDPLQLNDTYTHFSKDVSWADRMNSTYRYSGKICDFEKYWDNTKEQELTYFRGAGGLYSTAIDYARFLHMWMNKGISADTRMLSEKSVESALYPYADRGDGRRYGMFWTIQNQRMVNQIPVVFGHGGSDNLIGVALPEIEVIAVFFTQSRFSNTRQKFLYHLSQLELFEELRSRWNPDVEQAAISVENKPSHLDLEKFVGSYKNGRRENTITLENKALYLRLASNLEAAKVDYLSGNTFMSKTPCGDPIKLTFIFKNDEISKMRMKLLTGNAITFNKERKE